MAACSDAVDNDGDGAIDLDDPGCLVSLDDDEEDIADYPEDLGCDSASDADEFNADPSICGANVSLEPLPEDGVVDGFFDDARPNELNDVGEATASRIRVEDLAPGTYHLIVDARPAVAWSGP